MLLVKNQKTKVVNSEEREQERDCAVLIRQLADSNPTVRRWAARDLLECPDFAGVLVDHLHLEKDPSVRDVIFTTLTNLGNEIAVLGLVPCLRSEDISLRNEAIEAMKRLSACHRRADFCRQYCRISSSSTGIGVASRSH